MVLSAGPVAPVDVEARRAWRDGSGAAPNVDAARTEAGGVWGGAEKVGMPLSAEASGKLEKLKDVTVSAPADLGGRQKEGEALVRERRPWD